jgi:hypothetical protein
MYELRWWPAETRCINSEINQKAEPLSEIRIEIESGNIALQYHFLMAQDIRDCICHKGPHYGKNINIRGVWQLPKLQNAFLAVEAQCCRIAIRFCVAHSFKQIVDFPPNTSYF